MVKIWGPFFTWGLRRLHFLLHHSAGLACPYITHIMIYHSLGQVLIRQGWEASFPDVGLNKFVKVASAPRPIPKANNTWLEKDSFLPQSLFYFKNLVLLLIHSLSLITIYLSLVTQTLLCKYKYIMQSLWDRYNQGKLLEEIGD